MKHKIDLIQICLFAMSFGACNSYDHLPEEEDFKQSIFGTHIVLYHYTLFETTTLSETKGELIAVSTDSIYVLNLKNICSAIPRELVNGFDLQYAKPHMNYWTTPASLVLSLSHGFFVAPSMLFNWAFTAGTRSQLRSMSFSDEAEMSIDALHPFARFPRGLPQGVTKNNIGINLNSILN